MDLLKCEICFVVFASTSTLNRHLRDKHYVGEESFKNEFICAKCEERFSKKTLLRKHIYKDHRPHRPRNFRILCPKCSSSLRTYKLFRSHLRHEHQIKVEEHSINFEDLKSFYQWKENIEKQDCVSFIRNSAQSKHDLCSVTYFFCHRSKTATLKPNRSRKLKKNGSVKLGYACPAAMILREYSSNIVVNYCSTHLHSCELKHLRLSKIERSYIAGKLSTGATPKKILEEVHNSTPDIKHRLHLLNRKDIQNIIRDFDILKRNHQNDVSNVQLFVESFNANDPDNNPVIFFKQQGDVPVQEYESLLCEKDFILIICSTFERDMVREFGDNIICVNASHSLDNRAFLLHNILTVDEFGQGIPVAHCFSNKKDAGLYQIFFLEIMKVTGVVNPKILMTDDDPAIINAWISIMGIPTKHIFCIWNILENWRENLSKIKCEEKRSIVYQMLKPLYSILNLARFEQTLENVCKNLVDDADTVEFGIYFVSYYIPRKEKWAYAYRKQAGINTNNYLESLHKQIKLCIVEGKHCRRLDDALNAVLNLIRNKFFNLAINLDHEKCLIRMQKIEAAHEQMKYINEDSIYSINETKFAVFSDIDNRQYSIEKVNPPDHCSCKLRCNMCSICVHQYKCSCPNNAIAYNICEHIHALHFWKFVTNNDTEISNYIVFNDIENSNTSVVLEPTSSSTLENSVVENLDILKKLYICIGLYQRNEEAIPEYFHLEFNSYLDKSIAFMTEVEKSNFIEAKSKRKISEEKQPMSC